MKSHSLRGDICGGTAGLIARSNQDIALQIAASATIRYTMVRQLLIFVHLFSAIVWVGGMFFAYFCLRPAAMKVLEPPKRLPLWVATFELFFRFVAYAIALILISGFAMLLQTGFKFVPIGWHIMLALGLLMAAIFGYVYGILFPRFRHHCEAMAWPAAAAALNDIRRMVGVNLLLAAFTVAAAIFSRVVF